MRPADASRPNQPDEPDQTIGDPAWPAQRLAKLARISLAVAQADLQRLDAALAACAADPEISAATVAETILQGVPYAGFPGAVEALGAWSALAGASSAEASAGAAPAAARDAGARLFREVYGDVDQRVLAELRKRHPDLESWILEFAYGRVLCRDALPLAVREVLGVASLLGQGRRSPLHSHIRGALRCGLAVDAMLELLDALAPWCDAAVIEFARQRCTGDAR